VILLEAHRANRVTLLYRTPLPGAFRKRGMLLNPTAPLE
jgi:hypothetical protein